MLSRLVLILVLLAAPSLSWAQGTVNARTQAGDGTPITDTVSGRLDVTTQATIGATQSGTWNLNNISGSIVLPTGASTETTLASLLGRFPTAFASADAIAAQTATAMHGLMFAWSGTAWDRVRQTSGAMHVNVQNASLAVTQSGSWTVQPGNTANTTAWLVKLDQTGTNNDVDAAISNFPTTASTSAVSIRCVNTAGNAFEACGGAGGSGGDGAINDGVSSAIKATVFDYTNANPLATRMVDGNGDPVSVGGGTQYSEDTASADAEQLMMAGAVRQDTPASSTTADGDRSNLKTDSVGRLWVNGSGVTQPVSGTVTANVGTTNGLALDTSVDGLEGLLGTSNTNTSNTVAGVGATSDAAATVGSAGSLSAKLRLITSQLDALQTELNQKTEPANTQAISAASLPLPTGAATLAEQQTQTTALQLIDNLPLTQGAATTGQSGVLSQGAVTTAAPTYTTGTTNPLSLQTNGSVRTAIADALPTGANTIGGVNLSQYTPVSGRLPVDGSGVTQPVSLATNQPVGTVAHDGVDSGNPVKTGCHARTTNRTAVADADRADVICDKLGRQIVTMSAPRERVVRSGVVTLSTTTETTLIAAGGAGVFRDLVYLKCTNSSATLVRVDLRDATAGTVIDSWALAASGGGFNLAWPVPYAQATANGNWTIQLSAAVSDVRCSAQAVENN